MDAFRAATLAAKSPASLSDILMAGRLHGLFSGIEDHLADGVLGSRGAGAQYAGEHDGGRCGNGHCVATGH